jgi:hypothetical protein
MPTAQTTEMLAAGFTYDEIKADAAKQHREMLSAGFSQQEADNDIASRYNMRVSYDEDLEDDLPVVSEILDSDSAETLEKQQIQAEVNHIFEQKRLAELKAGESGIRESTSKDHWFTL